MVELLYISIKLTPKSPIDKNSIWSVFIIIMLLHICIDTVFHDTKYVSGLYVQECPSHISIHPHTDEANYGTSIDETDSLPLTFIDKIIPESEVSLAACQC